MRWRTCRTKIVCTFDVNMKLKHWRGSRGKNALGAAPNGDPQKKICYVGFPYLQKKLTTAGPASSTHANVVITRLKKTAALPRSLARLESS